MTILEAIKYATLKLKNSSSPGLDSEVLLAHALNKSRAFLLANLDKKLTKSQKNLYTKLIRKRTDSWPVAYLTGKKEFYGLNFKITPDTLIPRPDSELLVELALKAVSSKLTRIKQIVDVGTGSGCIIISIAKSLPRKKINFIATDISEKALKIAKQNARAHKVQIKFYKSNLLKSLPDNSLVVANLPYLAKKQLNNLTIKHEPKKALYGGKDGLKYFKELFKQIKKAQSENLTILLEHDPIQKKSLANLTKKYFPSAKIKFHRDLSGKWRVLEVIIPSLA